MPEQMAVFEGLKPSKTAICFNKLYNLRLKKGAASLDFKAYKRKKKMK